LVPIPIVCGSESVRSLGDRLQPINRSKIARSIKSPSTTAGLSGPIFALSSVRLKVEENQLVDVFGEISTRIEGLKGA